MIIVCRQQYRITKYFCRLCDFDIVIKYYLGGKQSKVGQTQFCLITILAYEQSKKFYTLNLLKLCKELL